MFSIKTDTGEYVHFKCNYWDALLGSIGQGMLAFLVFLNVFLVQMLTPVFHPVIQIASHAMEKMNHNVFHAIHQTIANSKEE